MAVSNSLLKSWIRRSRKNAAGVVVGLACILAGAVAGEQVPTTPFPQPGDVRKPHLGESGTEPFGDSDPATRRKRMDMLNVERQKELVSETERLLRLAQEFNAEVSQGDGSDLTPVQVRKLNDIGKLAKSVKDKMMYGLGGNPSSFDSLGNPR